MTKLSLKQIQDIDNLPFYLKKLGELALEDNNIVLNESLPGSTGSTTEKSLGAGFTINNGDGINQDVTFNIVSLSGLTQEHQSDLGFLNRGWSTELNDILLEKNNPNNPNGLRVIKESDIINGGVIGSGLTYSGSTKEVTYLNKVLLNSGEIPSVNDLLPGQLAINVYDGKLFTLKGSNGNYEVIQIGDCSGTTSSGTTSGTTSGSTSDSNSDSTSGSTPTIQNLTWTSPAGTSNEERYPAYGYYDYSHSMFIIRASEIGSGSKIIHGLQIEMAGYTGSYTYANQTIKLAHTSDLEFGDNVKVDLTNINNVTNLTTVKANFNWTIGSSGFQTIEFDTNFEYNGSDSLLIIWENRDGNWNSGFGWAECWFDNTYVDSWYKYQDNSYPTGYGTKDLSYRPNFKLNY